MRRSTWEKGQTALSGMGPLKGWTICNRESALFELNVPLLDSRGSERVDRVVSLFHFDLVFLGRPAFNRLLTMSAAALAVALFVE